MEISSALFSPVFFVVAIISKFKSFFLEFTYLKLVIENYKPSTLSQPLMFTSENPHENTDFISLTWDFGRTITSISQPWKIAVQRSLRRRGSLLKSYCIIIIIIIIRSG